MWGLLSPKALLAKHDYICWDESNHDVTLLIGRSWVKTAQWACEHEPKLDGGSEGEDVLGPTELEFALHHFLDLSSDLEATVVMTNINTGIIQRSVSFLSDPYAVMVLMSREEDADFPLAAIVMKAVKPEQRVLCVRTPCFGSAHG